MKRSIALLIMFVTVSAFSIQKKIQYVRYVEEKINNILFAHRVDIIDGVTQDRWFMNGKNIDESTYEDSLLNAEKEERRVERKNAEEKKRQEEREEAKNQEFLKSARFDIARKRLGLLVKAIEVELAKVKEPKLEGYIVYNRQGIASPEQFQQLQIDLIPGAKKILRSRDSGQESELVHIANALDPYILRLREMFRATVKNAIDRCDDTRLLKELLEIVS